MKSVDMKIENKNKTLGGHVSVTTKIRTITAIITLPVLVSCIYLGGFPLYFLMFLLTFVGQYELLKGFKIADKPILFITAINSVAYYIAMYNGLQQHMISILTAYVVILLVYYVFSYPKYEFTMITQSIISFVYVNVLLSYVVLIRINEPYGKWFVWLVFLISFGSDTFAYFAGRKFGRHKLVKNLSPKKTVEGAIGGILGAILLTVLYGIFMYYRGAFDDLSKLGYLAILGGIGAILSILGDLVASGIKRQNNIKDFGTLLPGHGGILDRFDSNIFTAPFVYYIMVMYIL